MTKTELIIFDLDGTLVDSESVYQMGWATVLKDFGHNVEVADFELMRGKGRHHNNQYIKSYLGTDALVQEARNLREEYYFNALNNNEVQLMPGALELIEEAFEQGIILAVATSSYRDRGKATLDQFDLSKYFTYQVFGDEVENAKPHPEIYNKVLELAGVEADKAVAVEDSLSGLKSALDAQLTVYFVPEAEVSFDKDEKRIRRCNDLHEVKNALFK